MDQPKRQPNPSGEKTLDHKGKCVKISGEDLRKAKLERIERQLYLLIGQVRELKTT